MKILLITNMFTPYWVPLLKEISRIAGGRGWGFRAAALSKMESNRDWRLEADKFGFDAAVIRGLDGKTSERGLTMRLNWGVFRELSGYKPDVIITSGYDSIAYWQAFIYARATGRKFVLRSGTTMMSAKSVGGIRGLLKRALIKGSDGFIAYGTKAKEYLECIGADSSRINICINTVDMEYFRERAGAGRCRRDFPERRGRYPGFLMLYSGQLIRRKGLSRALAAIDRLNDPEIGLIVVGSGPQEAELKRFCERRGLNVYFEGFKQQDGLPEYYALADALVLPSIDEVWGLVVNEALAAGQYVLCSKYAGAGHDLIRPGWSGELFDPDDIDALAYAIRRLKKDIVNIRERRDEISRQAVREFSIGRSAQAFIETFESVGSAA